MLVALIPLALVVAALVTSIAIYASRGPSVLASSPNTTGAHGATAPSDNGATALPNASGTAVEQDGTWKVSVNTLCALVALSGDASQSPGSGC